MLSKNSKFSEFADRDPQDSRMALITLLLQKLAPLAQKILSTGTLLTGLALFKNKATTCTKSYTSLRALLQDSRQDTMSASGRFLNFTPYLPRFY